MLNNPSILLILDTVLFIVAVGLLIPATVLGIECTTALLPNLSKVKTTETPRPKLAVLIPAHNEALGIGATLKTVLPQLTDSDRLVVIADNCTDATAEIARNLGATVVERHNQHQRGKGYALDYGLRFLESDPPETVVLIDADCIVHEGAIDKIARLAAAQGRPVQATYLMERPAKPSAKDSVSALAFMVKNLVRPAGLAQLGLPGLLTGSGMAFPWSVIQNVPLASGNIVEDMQLGLDLAVAGHPPMFCQNARVTGRLPQQQQAAKGQRTRWEHGHMQTLLTQVPLLFSEALRQQRFDLLALALDMCVPPLSLLVMLWLAVTGVTVLVAMLGASSIPAILLSIAGVFIFVSIIGAWAKFGRADLPVLTLLAVPFYLLWKIPLYLAFMVRPQTKWVRTERDIIDARES